MNRDQAMNEIKSRVKCEEYLERSKGGLFCCPYCGSGKGPHGTGAVKVYDDTNKFYCHACDKSGDVIDAYAMKTGRDFNTALSELAAKIGITIDSHLNGSECLDWDDVIEFDGYGETSPTLKGGILPKRQEEAARKDGEPFCDASGVTAEARSEGSEEADYTEYYSECRERLDDPEAVRYLQGRGISVETARRFWIGFDPKADPVDAPGATGSEHKRHPCPRIITPTCTGHYVARSIDPATPPEYRKMNPSKEKGAAGPGVFNRKALRSEEKVIFVTEGAFDALSVEEVGSCAVSINSANNVKKLLELVKTNPPRACLVLCLDNDDDGRKASETLSEGLSDLKVLHITADICGGYKDPNAFLVADRAKFAEAVNEARRRAEAVNDDDARPDSTLRYLEEAMGEEIKKFKSEKPTGFATLDRLSGGGLHPGLYVLAAISSLGKTSFALQLADQLAEGGHDVIFFSLEQSRLELVSKSLARGVAQTDRKSGTSSSVTSLSIRKGWLPDVVLDAAKEYREKVGNRVSIIEGNFSCNVLEIGEYVKKYIKRTGVRPVVFVDYLQILQPVDARKRQTTKETIDETITELKRLSRDLNLTTVVISSVNRANYLTPIDFESLKESGSIEFSCDVLWGLQLQCLNSVEFEKAGDKIKEKREIVRKAKAANPRKIELSCLKNRYGVANYSCLFDYYPANDLFEEDDENKGGFPWNDMKLKRV